MWAGSSSNSLFAARMWPVQVEQIVMTSSKPSASACAYVRALRTRATSRLVSLRTDAPQHDAAVSSTSSMSSFSASNSVELNNSLHDSLATQPGKNPYLRICADLDWRLIVGDLRTVVRRAPVPPEC